MESKDYLKILKDEIHSVVVATIDDNGLPQTRVIDIMLVDDNSVYFITAKGKKFYHQLMKQEYVSISGMSGGKGSLNKKSISLRGKVKNIGQNLLDKVFEENPAEIANYFDYKGKEFRISIAVKRAKKLSIQNIAECLRLILESNLQLLTSSLDRKFIVSKLLVLLIQKNLV